MRNLNKPFLQFLLLFLELKKYFTDIIIGLKFVQ